MVSGPSAGAEVEAKRLSVEVPSDASPGERGVAETLRKRIKTKSRVEVRVGQPAEAVGGASPELVIVLRRAAASAARGRRDRRTASPRSKMGRFPPEAFALQARQEKAGPLRIVAEGPIRRACCTRRERSSAG